MAGVLDESANTLFLTELWRGLALTLKVFFERPVTVSMRTLSEQHKHPAAEILPIPLATCVLFGCSLFVNTAST